MRTRPDRIREACVLSHAGRSYREICKELGVALSTVAKWAKTEIWEEEWERLDQLAQERRDRVVALELDSVEAAAKELWTFSLKNLKGATKVQESVWEALQNIKVPQAITSIEDLALAVKSLRELSGLVQQSWDNFVLATDLQAYLEGKQPAPEIDFEAFSEEEIEAIRSAENN